MAVEGAAGDLRFRPADRLLERRDFDRVLRRGRRRSSSELAVIVAPPGRLGRGQSRNEPRPSDPNGGDSGARLRSRLGITVGRKCGPSVERNRFKRRVREWFRAHRDELGSPVDIVVIARREAMALSYAQLVARLAILTQTIPSQPAGIKG